MSFDEVRAWAETVTIPTYRIGAPDKNPMFLEKRVYQGSSGVVYPHPVIDRITDEKYDQEYTAVFLENRYLKVMILPEIGGRVQMALDKTNGYHFVYYNRVIKPALVGLAGPWISGGIEFNWPQHHRPSTFDPLDWRIIANPDGSQTVWCGEIESMFRTKGMHGFTLYPERAYLEISVQLYNRTNEPQTFLWWANPAVHVHEDTQSVFPPDVHAVMDHGKRDVSDFPIATGEYYKVNYHPGTDIRRYSNIPVPTSYMAYHSDFDYIGNYDHRLKAGMIHVANHHLVPGKKQWTWGCSDFGKAWDRQLTDEDGPYIELMCGAFTDNQPDFSWIMPGEEKSFTQVFMPYKRIGAAKNASSEAVLNLEVEGGQARLGVYLTQPRHVCVRLVHRGTNIFEKTQSLDPRLAMIESINLPDGAIPQDLTLSVLDGEQELLSYTPLPDEKPDIPASATPAPLPYQVASSEELYLHGLHLEQYRHATRTPEPYFEEALRRDPFDSRCNNALGLLLYRRGKFAQAEAYFRLAIQRLTSRNPNPYDGEPYYNLGLALKMQGSYPEAFDAFYKAVWNAAWQDAAYFQLARLACLRGDYPQALDLLENALGRNCRHQQARHLKIALMRHQGQNGAALQEVRHSLSVDVLDYGALWEQHLLAGDDAFWHTTRSYAGDAGWQGTRRIADTCIEIALDYAHAGLWQDAVHLLEGAPASDPLVRYSLGWALLQSGDSQRAQQTYQQAANLPPDYVFPNRLEDVLILGTAAQLNPDDPRACYYLGNFWYAHRQNDDAIACWEHARQLDPDFPTVHRNLGLAYYNQRGDASQALQSLETAFSLDRMDARLLFELDQLYKKLNHPPAERLARLERYPALVEHRDDLMIERISLYNLLGEPQRAYQLLMGHNFHPWEGGEGKTTGQYLASLVEIARRHLRAGEFSAAQETLEKARQYPPNLGEGKRHGAQENNIFYYQGIACLGLEDAQQARLFFERASIGLSEPTSAIYYNVQPQDMIYYQGLAWRELGYADASSEVFHKLIDYGQAHMDDPLQVDYFAVSLPDFLVFEDDLQRRNQVHCHYMQALGAMGCGESARARGHFEQVLRLDASHLGATLHLKILAEQDE